MKLGFLALAAAGTATAALTSNPPPNAFLIGAAKSASTSLFDSLVQHPGMCQARILEGEESFQYKELHFWEKETYADKISGWPRYMKHFSKCNASELRMDGTPNQINRLEVPEYLHKLYSEKGFNLEKLKFVAIMREPCARAVSLYEHDKRLAKRDPTMHFADRPFIEIVHEEIDAHRKCNARYTSLATVDRANKTQWEFCDWTTGLAPPGKYSFQFRHWFRYFKPAQFFIFTMDQYINKWDKVRPALLAHLGLKDIPLRGLSQNGGTYEKPAYPQELVDFFADSTQDLRDLIHEHPEAFFQASAPSFMDYLTCASPNLKMSRKGNDGQMLEPVQV